MATSLINNSAARIQSEVAALEAQLELKRDELAEAYPPQEPTDTHAVVRFNKYGGEYTFAALKVGNHWFLTQDGSRSSRQGHSPRTWTNLLVWIGERNWGSIEVLG